MPDVYTTITAAGPKVIEAVATAMEVSAADPQHLAMINGYVTEMGLSPKAKILEIGSGTGAVCRELARQLPEASIVGVDPSSALVARAGELATGVPSLRFEVAEGSALPFGDDEFDAVVLHRVLCHVHRPDLVLSEAFRVLRATGKLAVFDGDYATITLATGANDPLSCCVAAFQATYFNDPWLVRRLPSLVRAAGFSPSRMRSHGVIEVEDPDYLLSVTGRGADALGPPAASVPTSCRRSRRRHAGASNRTSSSDTSPTPALSRPHTQATRRANEFHVWLIRSPAYPATPETRPTDPGQERLTVTSAESVVGSRAGHACGRTQITRSGAALAAMLATGLPAQIGGSPLVRF